MSYFTDSRHVLPDGVFPTMITPMNDDKSVDWTGVDSESRPLGLVRYTIYGLVAVYSLVYSNLRKARTKDWYIKQHAGSSTCSRIESRIGCT